MAFGGRAVDFWRSAFIAVNEDKHDRKPHSQFD